MSAGTLGLAALELVPQQLAEEVVVAIPLARPVERHHEAVRARERLERVRRPRRLEHGVAETAAHTIQDRGVLEELRLGLRQPGEELEAEVLGYEPVAAGEALGTQRACRPGPHRQRRQVQAGRPSFRSLGQLGDLAVVELDSRASSSNPASCSSSRRSATPISCTEPCARQRPSGSAGSSLLAIAICEPAGTYRNSAASTSRQAGLATACRSSSTSTSGRSSAASALPTTGNACGPGGSAWAGQRFEHLGRDRLDAVNRGRDVAQEHDGVVVSAVERDPRERTRIGLGPSCEEGRLAVPGRRDHGRERRGRSAQPSDDVRLRHGAGPWQRGGEQPGEFMNVRPPRGRLTDTVESVMHAFGALSEVRPVWWPRSLRGPAHILGANHSPTDSARPLEQTSNERSTMADPPPYTPVLDLLASMTADSVSVESDPQALMLVRIAALVAVDAPPASYFLDLRAAGGGNRPRPDSRRPRCGCADRRHCTRGVRRGRDRRGARGHIRGRRAREDQDDLDAQ